MATPFPLPNYHTPIHILIPFLCNILVYAAASLSRIHYTALSGPPSKGGGGSGAAVAAELRKGSKGN